MYKRSIFFFLSIFSIFNLQAIQPKAFSSQEEAECYLTTHYNLGCDYYNKADWRQAYNEFEKVIYFFPNSAEAANAYYYLGVSLYGIGEYDFSNEAFSNYLKASAAPPYFEDVVYYKYSIAEIYKHGRRKHPFHNRYLPRTACGKELALQIFDEIVVALPCHELAVSSLFSKAELLVQMKNYRQGIETYQLIIRRFPDHEKAPLCYLRIAHAFYLQSKVDFQNPDIYGLAELNLKKFELEFPRDERICTAKKILKVTKENFAAGYSRLAGFYQRTGHPEAAQIYYRSGIENYPDTAVADYCRSQLANMDCKIDSEEVIEETPQEVNIEKELQSEIVFPDSAEARENNNQEEPLDSTYELDSSTANNQETKSHVNEEVFQNLLADNIVAEPLTVYNGSYGTVFYEEPVYNEVPYAKKAEEQIGRDRSTYLETIEPETELSQEIFYEKNDSLDQEAYEATFYEKPVEDEFCFPQGTYELPIAKRSIYEEEINDEGAVYLHYSLLKNR